MYLKRQDVIGEVMKAFNSNEYKSVINKRLCYGLYNSALKRDEIIELNNMIKRLDNPMLKGYEFYLFMDESIFDRIMCRLLYVSGKWVALSNYNIITSFAFKICNCYEVKMTDTVLELFYITANGEILAHIDDENIGMKIRYTISNNKEF